jgi:hypothetical protein
VAEQNRRVSNNRPNGTEWSTPRRQTRRRTTPVQQRFPGTGATGNEPALARPGSTTVGTPRGEGRATRPGPTSINPARGEGTCDRRGLARARACAREKRVIGVRDEPAGASRSTLALSCCGGTRRRRGARSSTNARGSSSPTPNRPAPRRSLRGLVVGWLRAPRRRARRRFVGAAPLVNAWLGFDRGVLCTARETRRAGHPPSPGGALAAIRAAESRTARGSLRPCRRARATPSSSNASRPTPSLRALRRTASSRC